MFLWRNLTAAAVAAAAAELARRRPAPRAKPVAQPPKAADAIPEY